MDYVVCCLIPSRLIVLCLILKARAFSAKTCPRMNELRRFVLCQCNDKYLLYSFPRHPFLIQSLRHSAGGQRCQAESKLLSALVESRSNLNSVEFRKNRKNIL